MEQEKNQSEINFEIGKNIILKIRETIEDDNPFLSFTWHFKTSKKVGNILEKHKRDYRSNNYFWKEAYDLLKPDLIEKVKKKLDNNELKEVEDYEERLNKKINNFFKGYVHESKFLKKYFDLEEFGTISPVKTDDEINYSISPSPLDSLRLDFIKTYYSKTLYDISENGRVKIEIQDVGDDENINHIIRIFTPEYCDMFEKTLYNKVFEGGELTDEDFEKLFEILKIKL